VYLLAFHAYIYEIHGSRSKIPSKKSRQAALCGGGFNSGVKGLNESYTTTRTTRATEQTMFFSEPHKVMVQ
jgi:hypothetical protein